VIKSISAREIFKKCPDVKKQLWGGEFWCDGDFAILLRVMICDFERLLGLSRSPLIPVFYTDILTFSFSQKVTRSSIVV